MRILSSFFLVILSLVWFCSCKGETKKPVTTIDQLIKLYPDSVGVLVKHGNVMMERYRWDLALQDGAKAYRLAPKNIDARFLYAAALNNQPERTAQDVLLAQEHFKFILSKQAKNTRVLVAMATTFWYMKDDAEAFKYINTALRIDKKYRDAYVLKGTIYRQLGKTDLAVSSYQTAIDQDKDFYEAYFMIGEIYLGEENPLAIDYYRSAVELQPNNIDFMYSLAYSLQLFGQKQNNVAYFDEALQTYRIMNKKDPKFAISNFQMGYIKQLVPFYFTINAYKQNLAL
jgi:tetratricopeptide (TPR) repeat protein